MGGDAEAGNVIRIIAFWFQGAGEKNMRDLHEEKNRIRTESVEARIMDLVGCEQDDLLENTQENPLGHLLKLLSTLPEIREEKVFRARQQIHQQDTLLDHRLDMALDRVLEELISEG